MQELHELNNHLLLADQRRTEYRDCSDNHNGSMSADEMSQTPEVAEDQQEDPLEERLISLKKQLDIEMKVMRGCT